MSLQPFDSSSLQSPGSNDTGLRVVNEGMRRFQTSYTDEETRKKHMPKKRTKISVVLVALLAFLVLMVGIVSYFARSCSLELALIEQEEAEVIVEIPAGYGSGDISQTLRDAGVIQSTTAFIQAVSAQGAEGALQAGSYTFTRGMSYEDVVSMLVAGPEVTGVTITIPEGLTVAQTAQRFADVFSFTYDEFMGQAKASNYVGEFTFLNGAFNNSLEGFLFPKTYSFEGEVTPDTAIRAMLKQYESETSGIAWGTFGQGNVWLTEYQVVCMASLIERETAVPEERPYVASVIYNRLNADWFLQIDAAIAYALNKGDLLTYADLEVDSPYNTYTNKGLVPGPICSPSLSSINAVVNAAYSDYLFYVAAPALDGSHVFCSTEDEFLVARNAYNEAAGIVG